MIATASTGNNVFFAGSGTDWIAGGAGNDTLFAGSGNAELTGGGGSNLFAFVKGNAGGQDIITDFETGTDHLSLLGYGSNAVNAALHGASTSGGATTLTLGDGTHVVLQGVGHLTAAAFA
jgi:Ca2+-binding RTX toxin-like protein